MSESQELATTTVTLRKNGDLVTKEDGAEIVVAHFDRTTGHLEYATRKYSIELHTQVTSRLGTVNKGTDPSNLVIRSVGIKGVERADTSKAPKKPRMGPEGNLGYETAKWYFDHDRPQFDILYRPFRDGRGEYVRKHARRFLENTVDERNSKDDDELLWVKDGKGTQTKGPIRRELEMVESKNSIIAGRGTGVGPNGEAPITFSADEVVGGFMPEEQEDDQ